MQLIFKLWREFLSNYFKIPEVVLKYNDLLKTVYLFLTPDLGVVSYQPLFQPTVLTRPFNVSVIFSWLRKIIKIFHKKLVTIARTYLEWMIILYSAWQIMPEGFWMSKIQINDATYMRIIRCVMGCCFYVFQFSEKTCNTTIMKWQTPYGSCQTGMTGKLQKTLLSGQSSQHATISPLMTTTQWQRRLLPIPKVPV